MTLPPQQAKLTFLFFHLDSLTLLFQPNRPSVIKNLKRQMPFSVSLYDITGLANLCIVSSTSEGVATTVNGLLMIPACF